MMYAQKAGNEARARQGEGQNDDLHTHDQHGPAWLNP